MNCIIDNYIKFVEDFLTDYYKLLLGKNYNKKYISPFINKYISVRYYNNTIYSRGYSFSERINKELKNIAEELIISEKEREDYIKKIFTLFGYILYIDDCDSCENINSLIRTLIEEETSLVEDEDKDLLKKLISNFKKSKEEFLNLFNLKNFNLTKKRIGYNLYKVSINHNCDISKLYSEYAINKAFNSGTVVENKIYLTYVLLSGEVLKNVLDMNYNTNYIVDFSESLFTKDKKINKYLNALSNELVMSHISIKITYSEYIKNMDIVNGMIREGFSICLELDDSFINDIKILDIFSYVIVYEKYDNYDIIIENKDNIKTKLIFM